MVWSLPNTLIRSLRSDKTLFFTKKGRSKEMIQNGASTSSCGENLWPIISLVPNHIDLEDLENLMKLVVATYCPALAWMDARPWTALMSNIRWLSEDMVLAVSPQIWSTPSRAPSIPIRVPAISHRRKGDEDDDLMSVRSGTSTNVTHLSLIHI